MLGCIFAVEEHREKGWGWSQRRLPKEEAPKYMGNMQWGTWLGFKEELSLYLNHKGK